MNSRTPIRCSIRFSNASTRGAMRRSPSSAIRSRRSTLSAGADVFTYLNAARATTKRQFTLRTNWRSESGLVRAMNADLRSAPIRFFSTRFNSAPREPGPRADQTPLLFHGKAETPFHIWTSSEKEKTFRPRGVGDRAVCSGAAPPSTGKELEPGHIAVLTSTNAQATEMQIALPRAPGAERALQQRQCFHLARSARAARPARRRGPAG